MTETLSQATSTSSFGFLLAHALGLASSASFAALQNHGAFVWYSFKILPKIGKLVANDENSYKYLVESIRMHPNQEKLKSMIIDSGYNKCKFFNLLNGVVAIHKAVK